MELVAVERPQAGCALVTLQRPQALNALSLELRQLLGRTFRTLAQDGTRVIVLTGSGRAFCAGLDLRELAGSQDLKQVAVTGAKDDPVHALANFPGAVIAAVNGPAVTGGMELALACDIRIASERATFADTHTRVGVMPSWGMSQRLPRLIGRARALEMSLTGNFVAAQQALDWGLVNRVVPHEELLPAALRLAGEMLTTVPGMLERYKAVVDEGADRPMPEALALEAKRSREWAATLDPALLKQQTEAVQARGRGQTDRKGNDDGRSA